VTRSLLLEDGDRFNLELCILEVVWIGDRFGACTRTAGTLKESIAEITTESDIEDDRVLSEVFPDIAFVRTEQRNRSRPGLRIWLSSRNIRRNLSTGELPDSNTLAVHTVCNYASILHVKVMSSGTRIC
jgi:hypothetical protein